MATVAHAPACSRVATSVMSWDRALFSAASSDVSATEASVTALAASLRCCSEPLNASAADSLRVMRLVAATPRYCWTTTPSESCGVLGASGWFAPLLTSGAPEYKPLLTYSLMANPLRARDAAPNWSFALETWDSDAARASSRDASVD